ncbi:MBL fold metallo-hydrolase [Hoyosella altamirensis]|uniref:Glyoxylase-like metal-dependent hydrolase (Beta-lactamase superfamily II) n=1 Tax=Hoyosella altamirensis TaxID=616997 RepID=A0A839RRV6_9ACTN|nr:MBL fold metallo-hydrolase [Hoyosella altamirensis]MBB3038846.1 glyoxylase-like metal-dependent hydrolase (beta-lactamase superfamily II) [Hoyosella altamirensis]
MRIHHLNCGTFAPLGMRKKFVTHCLLIETETSGLVLVDSGLGRADVTEPRTTMRFPISYTLRPQLAMGETAVSQVEKLGYSARDVRHILLTHLDFDHAGGLRDFPEANVHISAAELRAARNPSSVIERRRYSRATFDHKPRWVEHSEFGSRWFGFDAVRDIPGLPEQILYVPLEGHTRGHCGVAINTAEQGTPQWLLHAGDSYYSHTEIGTPPSHPRVFAAMESVLQTSRSARLSNLARLREVARNDAVDVICAHDPADLARYSAR